MVPNVFRSKKDVVIINNEVSKTVSHNCGEIICNLFGKLQLGIKFNT